MSNSLKIDSDSGFQNRNKVGSVESFPNESSLSEDAEIAISSNRCTPATAEINSPRYCGNFC
jgi:hypothetical protein